jgi:hypothetical protein
MHRQIALGCLQKFFQFVEFGDFALLGQIGHDAQPESSVYNVVDLTNIERRHAISPARSDARVFARM